MKHRSKGTEDGEVIDDREQRNEVCCLKNENKWRRFLFVVATLCRTRESISLMRSGWFGCGVEVWPARPGTRQGFTCDFRGV